MSTLLPQLMAWYPNKKLYKGQSSVSKKLLITVYPDGSPIPLLSHEEWINPNRISPSLPVDLHRPFFDQFAELQKITPVVCLLSNQQENAEYCQDVEQLKNSYIVFDAINGEEILYCVRVYNCKSCMDSYWIKDSELLYDCTYMFSCYNVRYSFNCKNVSDSMFLVDCHNVKHAFMCSNWRNKEFGLFNRQVTQHEFETFMASHNFTDPAVIAQFRQQFETELLPKTICPPAFLENCEDVQGNYLKNCQRVRDGFESWDLQDCEDVFQCADGHHIRHAYMCNDKVAYVEQCVATGIQAYNVKNSAFVWKSSNIEYSYLCINCQDCFGCIGLRNQKFCIFNRQYSQADYEILRTQLVAAMSTRGEYGNFFPIELSPFRYEDTIAADFFRSPVPSQDPLNFNKQELQFYEQHRIAKPDRPFAARYLRRIQLMDTALSLQPDGSYFKKATPKTIVDDSTYLQTIH